jgi:hypothetical protein
MTSTFRNDLYWILTLLGILVLGALILSAMEGSSFVESLFIVLISLVFWVVPSSLFLVFMIIPSPAVRSLARRFLRGGVFLTGCFLPVFLGGAVVTVQVASLLLFPTVFLIEHIPWMNSSAFSLIPVSLIAIINAGLLGALVLEGVQRLQVMLVEKK